MVQIYAASLAIILLASCTKARSLDLKVTPQKTEIQCSGISTLTRLVECGLRMQHSNVFLVSVVARVLLAVEGLRPWPMR